jgi:hypothetical protein
LNTNEIKNWIDSSFIAREIITKEETPVLTFITNFGFIVGKRAVLREFDTTSEETIMNTLREELKEKGQFEIEPISLTNALFQTGKDVEVNKGGTIHDEDKLIHLEDAKIYYAPGFTAMLPIGKITLSVDQIVGIIPGEFSTKVDQIG